MEYTVKALSELSGITPRTLHWYDKVGLLKPGRITEAGYRLYGPEEVDRLQQILFYRELGFSLSGIQSILDAPDFDWQAALRCHLSALRQQRERLVALIDSVERTLMNGKGEIAMSDKEKFEGFKRELVEKNERLYGKEAREAYGSGPVEAAQKNLMGLSPELFQRWQDLDRELREGLTAAVRAEADPTGEEGKRAVRLHREWLEILMPDCDDARQAGIAELYVADERFTAYYDRQTPGCAAFLRNSVRIHVREK